jgi:hypothetical protein
LLDQVTTPVASFTADGAYDQEGVAAAVAERHPEAAVIVPPRSTAVQSETAEIAPTQRDRHLQSITERGRAAWQKASGYTIRARIEATIGRFKQVIGWRCPGRRLQTWRPALLRRAHRRQPYRQGPAAPLPSA